MASFDLYMASEPRNRLSSAANDSTGNPNPIDAGNWTGCGRNQGNLVGTYRDWSACAETQWLGRPPTVTDMRSITYNDLKQRIKRQFWDRTGIEDIPDQDIANIFMNIFMGYGNVRLVQRALNDEFGLNLAVDGSMIKTLSNGQLGETYTALLRNSRIYPARTYNAIWDKLYESFSAQYNTFPGLLNSLLNDFPPKKDETREGSMLFSGTMASIFVPLSLAIFIAYRLIIRKKR